MLLYFDPQIQIAIKTANKLHSLIGTKKMLARDNVTARALLGKMVDLPNGRVGQTSRCQMDVLAGEQL